MKKPMIYSSTILLGICLLPALPLPAFAQSRISRPVVIPEVKHDVSPPLRDLVSRESPVTKNRIALLNPTRIVPLAPGSVAQAADSLASSPLPFQVATTNILNFDGVNAQGFAPPDTNGSVGATQYVETVNLRYAVYDKTTG